MQWIGGQSPAILPPMNDLSPRKPPATVAAPPRSARISPGLRAAIKLRVETSLPIEDVCARAGVAVSGFYKAMKRQAVRDYYEAEQARFIREVDRRRASYRAQAIEVAAHLMHKAGSEAVRMRAVEFFASEQRGGPSVQVNVAVGGGGYEYLPPGARLVEIDGEARDVTPAGGGEVPAIHAHDKGEADQ